MKIKNNEKHKINKGKLNKVERDNSKKKMKMKIKESRKNKQIEHDFANQFMDDLL